MKIYGYYNAYGYTVGIGNEMIYVAGNHAQDSQAVTTPGSPQALPLETIAKFCEQASREIAEERGLEFGGVELDKDHP